MPRQVDPIQRRSEITAAAVRILARGGTGALTLRSLADELNGSITLVTHFFTNRSNLFEAIVDDLVDDYAQEFSEKPKQDPYGRLRRLLEWMLPLEPSELAREAGRIALNSMRGDHGIDHFFEVVDKRIRELLASHLEPLVPARDVPVAVDFLRACINGIALSAVEHSEDWTPRRQLATLDVAMRVINIDQSSVET